MSDSRLTQDGIKIIISADERWPVSSSDIKNDFLKHLKETDLIGYGSDINEYIQMGVIQSFDDDEQAPLEEHENKIKNIVNACLDKECDGLIIPGDSYIDKKFYSGNAKRINNINLDDEDNRRTKIEIALVKEALLRGIPILGIDDGNQIIDIVLGRKLNNDNESKGKIIYFGNKKSEAINRSSIKVAEFHPDENSQDSESTTKFINFCRIIKEDKNNNTNEFAAFQEKNKPIVNEINPVILVVDKEHEKRQGYEIEINDIVNAIDNEDDTAEAKLLKVCANPNISDSLGQTPLFLSVKAGKLNLIEALLANPETDSTICNDENYKSPLHIACEKNRDDIARLLLKHNETGINTQDSYDRTPLHYAAMNNNPGLIKDLFESGADIRVKDKEDCTPLILAAEKGHLGVVKLMHEYYISKYPKDNAYRERMKSATISAIEHGHHDVVNYFLENGLNPNNEIEENYDERPSLLSLAVEMKKSDIVSLLLAKGANANDVDERGMPLLHLATSNNDLETVKALLAYNADTNKLYNGSTVLIYAAKEGYIDVALVLLQKNPALVNQTHADTRFTGYGPLHYAVTYGHHETVKALLAHGADVNAQTKYGPTPIYLAEHNGYDEIVKTLLANEKIDLNIQDQKGKTQLHIAAEEANFSILEMLINNGAKLNVKDNQGNTPFHLLAKREFDTKKKYNNAIETMKLLIDNGVELYPKDNEEPSPLYLAVQFGHQEVADYLMDKMNKKDKIGSLDDLIIQATKNKDPEVVIYALMRKKYEIIDKSFPNTWEQRDILYEKEKEFIDKIADESLFLLKSDSNQFFEFMSIIDTDRARVEFFKKIFLNMTNDDGNFIIDNLPKLIGCFRSPDEFIYILEQTTNKNSDVKNEISKSIDEYYSRLDQLVDFMHEHQSDNIYLYDEDIDMFLSNRRVLIGSINLLSLPEPRMSLIKQLSTKLDQVIHDRYDWFNLIAGCDKPQDARNMVELIKYIFDHNPGLASRFSAKNIIALIDSVQIETDVAMARKTNKKPIKNINDQQYRVKFAASLSKKMFSHQPDLNVIIERNYQKENSENVVTLERKKNLIRRQSIIIKPDIKKTNKTEENAQKRLFQLVEMGRDYRNSNINFLDHGGWQAQRYSNPIPLIKRNNDDLIGDILSRIEGYNPETNFYRPFTAGNCVDQARIQLVYLAVTPQENSSLQGKTVLHVDSPHADHSYLIVTKLTQEEIKSLPRNEFGRIDMFSIFQDDKNAVLIDPWRMALFHYPESGLHYAEHPHNDAKLPKVSDPSFINIKAVCQIGKPETMQINKSMIPEIKKFDSLNKPGLNDKKEKLIETVNVRAIDNFRDKIDVLRNDPRWQQHCEQIESRAARKNAIQNFFELKSLRVSQPLDAYSPVRFNVNTMDNSGNTPLCQAAYKGDLHLVENLINAGANINQKNNDGWNPITLAAEAGHLDIVKAIFKHYTLSSQSSDPGSVKQKFLEIGYSAFFAIENGHLDILNFFLENHISPNTVIKNEDNHTKTLLVMAVENNQLEAVKLLLLKGADPNDIDDLGRTALHIAILNEKNLEDAATTHLVDELLNAGADPDITDINGRTPFQYDEIDKSDDILSPLQDTAESVTPWEDLCTVTELYMNRLSDNGYHDHHSRAKLNYSAMENIYNIVIKMQLIPVSQQLEYLNKLKDSLNHLDWDLYCDDKNENIIYNTIKTLCSIIDENRLPENFHFSMRHKEDEKLFAMKILYIMAVKIDNAELSENLLNLNWGLSYYAEDKEKQNLIDFVRSNILKNNARNDEVKPEHNSLFEDIKKMMSQFCENHSTLKNIDELSKIIKNSTIDDKHSLNNIAEAYTLCVHNLTQAQNPGSHGMLDSHAAALISYSAPQSHHHSTAKTEFELISLAIAHHEDNMKNYPRIENLEQLLIAEQKRQVITSIFELTGESHNMGLTYSLDFMDLSQYIQDSLQTKSLNEKDFFSALDPLLVATDYIMKFIKEMTEKIPDPKEIIKKHIPLQREEEHESIGMKK